MEAININDTVYSIIKSHPAFKAVLIEAGFDKILKKGMLESVGRVTPLKHGLKLRKVALTDLQTIANKHGFYLTETKR